MFRTKNNESCGIRGFFKSIPHEWLLFFAFTLFHMIIATRLSAPFFYPDEYGPITIGNWMFGGPEWSFKIPMYYGYTFSPFVGLMLQFFENIRDIYVGSLFIKALQISLIPFFCYKLLNEALGVTSARVKILLSVAVSLYPSFIVYSKYITNDSTLHFTLFICLYLIGKCAVWQSKDIPCQGESGSFQHILVSIRRDNVLCVYSVLLAFFTVFAYATHGMGLAFIVAVCFIIPVAHIATKKKLVSYPFFIGSFALFYFLDSKMKGILMEAVFRPLPTGEITNTFNYSYNSMTVSLSKFTGLEYFVKIFLSRLHYAASATFILLLLAAIVMMAFSFRYLKARFPGNALSIDSTDATTDVTADATTGVTADATTDVTADTTGATTNTAGEGAADRATEATATDPRDQTAFILSIFSLAVVICGITLSTLNNIGSVQGSHGTYYFYGRYYEYMVMPLIIMGAYQILCRGVSRKKMLIYSGVATAIYFLLSVYVQIQVVPNVVNSPLVDETRLNNLVILGVLPFIGNTYDELMKIAGSGIFRYSILALGLTSLVSFFVMLFLFTRKKRQWLALVVLAAMFAYGIFFDLNITALRYSGVEYSYSYAYMERLAGALKQYKDIYDEYPILIVISDRLGSARATFNEKRSRAQLAFNRYNVTSVLSIEEYQKLRRPRNAIIVSEKDHELETNDRRCKKIYEAPDVYVWLRGVRVIDYYESTR